MGGLLRSSSRVNDASPPATALRVQSSVQGQPITILHGQQRVAGNLIWYGDFSYTSGSGGGKGGKGGILGGGGAGGKGASGQSGASYSASFALGLCEGPIDVVLELWNNKTPQSLSGFFTADGYQGQPAWSGFGEPENIGYSSLCYAASSNYNLGNQPELPNFNFEVRGAIANAVWETYTVSSGSNYQYTANYFALGNSTVEPITIPPTPYVYTAQNPTAATALPVILGSIVNPVGTPSAGVVDTAGNAFTQVNGTPSATHQFSVDSSGDYTFYSGDEGLEVYIIDLAVSPGVSYIYQPTATFSQGVTSFTVSSTSGLQAGQLVTGPGIAPGTIMVDVIGTTVYLSQATTSAESGVTLTFWGEALYQVLGSSGNSDIGSSYGTFVGNYSSNTSSTGYITTPTLPQGQRAL